MRDSVLHVHVTHRLAVCSHGSLLRARTCARPIARLCTCMAYRPFACVYDFSPSHMRAHQCHGLCAPSPWPHSPPYPMRCGHTFIPCEPSLGLSYASTPSHKTRQPFGYLRLATSLRPCDIAQALACVNHVEHKLRHAKLSKLRPASPSPNINM